MCFGFTPVPCFPSKSPANSCPEAPANGGERAIHPEAVVACDGTDGGSEMWQRALWYLWENGEMVCFLRGRGCDHIVIIVLFVFFVCVGGWRCFRNL